MMRALPLDSLIEAASTLLAIDVEPIDAAVITSFGQRLDTIGRDGAWAREIQFFHVGYGTWKLKWGQSFHPNAAVEWIFRSCVVERMQTHVDVRPLFDIAPLLKELELSSDGTEVAGAILKWVRRIVIREAEAGRPQLAAGAKAIFQWCVEQGLPEFEEGDLESIKQPRSHRRRDHATLYLDQDTGPLTNEELRRFEEAISQREGWTRQRALFYLCRDWGVRPIQLALMRIDDFGTDDVGNFVLVPSVKGVRRSRKRRATSNMRKRYVSAETATALAEHIAETTATIKQLRARLSRSLKAPRAQVDAVPIPMFPSIGSEAKVRTMWDDQALRPYVMHPRSGQISREIVQIGVALQLKRSDRDAEDVVQLSAYRLRRTKATAMVISGHSPEDVAEALDHQGVCAVRHYFRFSNDLIDFVNAAHATSADIKEAAEAWSGRLRPSGDPCAGEVRVANLGICSRSDPCPYHPTVSCYACHKFQPFKDANHRQARRVILQLRDTIAEQSTGPVKMQLDRALAGANAVIEAVQNDRD